MTAVLIKSKLFNLVASGRESLFREDASCEGPGSAGPPRGGGAERAPLHQLPRAGPAAIAALPLPAGTAAAIMIFVLTHYTIIRISFARELPDAGAAAAEMYSSPRRYQGAPAQRSPIPARLS